MGSSRKLPTPPLFRWAALQLSYVSKFATGVRLEMRVIGDYLKHSLQPDRGPAVGLSR